MKARRQHVPDQCKRSSQEQRSCLAWVSAWSSAKGWVSNLTFTTVRPGNVVPTQTCYREPRSRSLNFPLDPLRPRFHPSQPSPHSAPRPISNDCTFFDISTKSGVLVRRGKGRQHDSIEWGWNGLRRPHFFSVRAIPLLRHLGATNSPTLTVMNFAGPCLNNRINRQPLRQPLAPRAWAEFLPG